MILHWEDRATDWSGMRDRVPVQLTLLDVQPPIVRGDSEAYRAAEGPGEPEGGPDQSGIARPWLPRNSTQERESARAYLWHEAGFPSP
jgi:hypothetical protein